MVMPLEIVNGEITNQSYSNYCKNLYIVAVHYLVGIFWYGGWFHQKKEINKSLGCAFSFIVQKTSKNL
jgi:hypothetical protein